MEDDGMDGPGETAILQWLALGPERSRNHSDDSENDIAHAPFEEPSKVTVESPSPTATERRLAAAKALLAELEAKAAEERRDKRERERKAEAARDKRLAATRGAALKQLYAAKGIETIPGDQFEKERFAALLKALKVKV